MNNIEQVIRTAVETATHEESGGLSLGMHHIHVTTASRGDVQHLARKIAEPMLKEALMAEMHRQLMECHDILGAQRAMAMHENFDELLVPVRNYTERDGDISPA